MSTYVFDQDAFVKATADSALHSYAKQLATAVASQGHALKHGHLDQWQTAVESLPATEPCAFSLVNGAVSIDIGQCTIGNHSMHADDLQSLLEALKPWRKGPFRFGPVFIDTEWHSDWKWDRLASHISPLKGRTVLDVGCGSGYHLWRMRHEGANLVLGIDPSLLYVKQFDAANHFIQDAGVHLLPLPMEAMPSRMQVFDTVFSMGVLYHRRDPHQHLRQLREAMHPEGELVLETLVIPGDSNTSRIIDGRYANMRNIYELPTVSRLCQWMEMAGFTALTVADVTTTSRTEQRSTDWMTSHSLAQALDSRNPAMTVEGHPRPLRAIVVANQSESETKP